MRSHSSFNRRRGPDYEFIAIVGGFALLVALIFGASTVSSFANQRQVTVTVNEKERVCDSDRNCRYLIFTDGGVFENTDSLLRGKFESSDIYNQIQPGSVETFTVVGWRVPFLSMYPNILDVRN